MSKFVILLICLIWALTSSLILLGSTQLGSDSAMWAGINLIVWLLLFSQTIEVRNYRRRR